MSGARVDDLTLAECLSYDPRPQRRGDRERFRCPRHGGDRQKSLSVDVSTGRFCCWNGECGIWGTLVEHQEHRPPGDGWGRNPAAGWGEARPGPPLIAAAPLTAAEYAVRRAVAAWRAFPGSAAAAYAQRRGVPAELARSLRLGYWRGAWQGEDSEWLTFPLRCPITGQPVGIYGRNLWSDDPDRKGRVLGPRGLFGQARPGALPADVLLTEGPFEAIALLANPALPPARAVIGASARAEWFDHCRRVTLLFDDDPPGRAAANRLVDELNARRLRRNAGPRVLCLRPATLAERHGVKDLGALLEQGVPIRLDLPPLAGA
jgi:hypothetical protein